MSPKVLVTGAAGYIGGTLVTTLLENESSPFDKDHISIAVRSKEQADSYAGLGVDVLQLDLTDEQAVIKGLSRLEVDIVVHTASSIDPRLAVNLVTALGKRKEITNADTYYVHTSGLGGFYERSGWPSGEFKDTDAIFEIEKQLADSFPIRKTDVTVIEHAKALGVTSFLVIPPLVYGRGTGKWNQLSILVPPYVAASISQKRVYKFPENTEISGVHISDLSSLYTTLLNKIVHGEEIPHGTEGYYFAIAHRLLWWDLLDHLAAALKARDLVDDTNVPIWPSDEVAAEALGVSQLFLQPLWNSGGNIVPENAYRIGWKPVWNRERFLRNIDSEVEDTLELGKAKSSLLSSLSGPS